MQLHVHHKGAAAADLVIRSADHAKNYKCFKYAVNQAPGDYNNFCKKLENIVYMKMTDYSYQYVSMDGGFDITNVKYAPEKSKMKVSRKMSTERNQRLGREEIDTYPVIDFETLWQVSFALENKVTHAREIGFIQDEDESRDDGKRRLKDETDSSEANAKAS